MRPPPVGSEFQRHRRAHEEDPARRRLGQRVPQLGHAHASRDDVVLRPLVGPAPGPEAQAGLWTVPRGQRGAQRDRRRGRPSSQAHRASVDRRASEPARRSGSTPGASRPRADRRAASRSPSGWATACIQDDEQRQSRGQVSEPEARGRGDPRAASPPTTRARSRTVRAIRSGCRRAAGDGGERRLAPGERAAPCRGARAAAEARTRQGRSRPTPAAPPGPGAPVRDPGPCHAARRRSAIASRRVRGMNEDDRREKSRRRDRGPSGPPSSAQRESQERKDAPAQSSRDQAPPQTLLDAAP